MTDDSNLETNNHENGKLTKAPAVAKAPRAIARDKMAGQAKIRKDETQTEIQ